MKSPGGLHTLSLGCGLLIGLGLPAGTPADESASLAGRYPPRAEERRPTSGWAPHFRRPVATATRERIPLKVDWADNDLEESVVTFGVPFARGALTDVRHVRVVGKDGKAAPAEFRVTATWDGADGPVRWALAHTVLRRGQEYVLEYGPEVQSVAGPGIVVTETDAGIAIDTGPMRATLSRQTASVLESLALDLDGDGRCAESESLVVVGTSRADLPVVIDAAGTSYFAVGAPQGLKAEVVESGPQRAVIRREGWYTDAQGNRFCQFITYTYFRAGQAALRHDHTLIVAFDTGKQQIRNVMLPVPLAVGPDAKARFAGDDSPEGAPIELPADGMPYSLVQTHHDAWKLTSRNGTLKTGSRAGGWFGLADNRWGVFAGLTDFWQQYPAALETAPDRLRLHLWPTNGVAPLDFRPSTILGADYPGSGQWYRDGLDEMTQAYGLGKTHTVHLTFFAASRKQEAWRQSRAQTVKPILAMPDPSYVCATDVMYGRVHPYDPERFPAIETMLDALVARYHRQREEHAQYGWIDFGDVYNTGRLWRRWASMFYGFPNLMPRLYLRSGRREAWDFHRVNTRHITDIDLCHLDNPAFRKEKGRRYGGDGCICHYAADLYTTGPDSHLDFMLMDYYLNGNLRTWEVAGYYLRAHAAARSRDKAMLGYEHRSTGGALRLFCEAYQATWDPEYLSIMRQLADILYQARAALGITRRDDVYMNPGKILYYRLTGDERMRDLFLNDMTALSQARDVHVLADPRAATLSGLAHAYGFTGDKKYLPFLLWQLAIPLERGLEAVPGLRIAIDATYGSQLPEAMAILAAVNDLPKPLGPAVPAATAKPLALKGNGAIYLQEPVDGAFRITVAVDLYRNPVGRFGNWREWVEQLTGAERPALRVIAPDGQEIRRVELTTVNTLKPIRLEFPADGQTGTYVLVPANLVTPIGIHLAESTLEKRVWHTGDNWVSGGINRLLTQRTFFFTVPSGTGAFRVEIKTEANRSRIQYGLRNARGALVAEDVWEVSSTPRNDWVVANQDAGEPERDEVWSITLNEAMATYLRFTGIPGYVASSPQELFTPAAALRQEMPPVTAPPGTGAVHYADSDLPWGGMAGYLRQPVMLEAPDKTALLDERCGTIELWVKPIDNHSTLADRSLLTCGRFNLLRRYNVGTYIGFGEDRCQRFFAIPNGRWTHLALTWKPSTLPGADIEIRLYADGVAIQGNDIGPSGTPHRKVPAGWAGKSLAIPAGLWVSGVRVSDVARYEQTFRRPDAPFTADEHTRVLCPFDGSGTTHIPMKKETQPP